MQEITAPRRTRAEPRRPDPAGGEAPRARSQGRADAAQSSGLVARFQAVRDHTEALAAPLGPEDQTIQSMPDASPTKWHRAHVTWFFENFLLAEHAPGYRAFDPAFAYLFNSYYEGAGPRHARPRRGLLTRPDTATVGAYRRHVDAAVATLLGGRCAEAVGQIVELGLHHEQQHQELLLTDILHAFAQNPLRPAYRTDWRDASPAATGGFARGPDGLVTTGADTPGFGFDNERPAHKSWLAPFEIGRALVTNSDWLAFIADGGYRTPTLWLADGWATATAEGWVAPGYWEERDGAWFAMTLGGLRPVDPRAAVRHVSFYEADAFARWAGARLPTEAEWETSCIAGLLDDAFGRVWQWTQSAYGPYPGFRTLDGTLGEYNGKFMANQLVLRGSSVATPAGHSRPTYRNFFYPHQRWQFTGLRLARDLR
jgi:ergothioneine biosynthesis protein EgtB